MELISSTGTSLSLTLDGYQFPEIVGAGDDDITADSNWLMIRGQARGSTVQWEFRDPCLLALETQWLASWLCEIATGMRDPAPVQGWDQDDPDVLSFLEPNLSFSFQSRTADGVVIRAYFSHESLPAGEALEEVVFFDLLLTPSRLAAAVDVWDQERQAFPPRG